MSPSRSTLGSAGTTRSVLPPLVWRWLLVLAVLLLWQAASRLGLVSTFTLPAPLEIAASFTGLWRDEDIIGASLRTVFETLVGGGLAAVLGVALGWWLHHVPAAGRAFTHWFAALAAAPLVLLYPIFLVVIGRNVGTIIVMGVIAALPPIVLKTHEGLEAVRPVLIAVGRSIRLSPFRLFSRILLPAALPTIFTGLRLGLIFALVNTVGLEFLLGFGGLGELVSDLGDRFDLAAMYGAILFVVAVSAGFLVLIEKTESWLLSHR